MKLDESRIMVTGTCGTVGQELVNHLLEAHAVKDLFIFALGILTSAPRDGEVNPN